MGDTIWARLLARAEQTPDAVALLQKRFGLWTATSIHQLVERAGHTALALQGAGISEGDRVALILKPHEPRVVIELALHLLSAQVVGIPTNTPSAILRHIIEDAQVAIAIVQGQAATDGLLVLIEEGSLSTVRRIHFVDPAGVQDYVNPILAPLPEVSPGHTAVPLRTLVEAIDPDAVVARSYTSGTTGPPTAVSLTHRNLVAAAESTMSAFGLGPDDRVLSFRALSDPVERGATLFPALLAGSVLVLPEARESVRHAMIETAPTYLHLTTRFVEEIATDVRLRMQASRGVKRWVLRSWHRRLKAAAQEGLSPAPGRLSRLLVGRPVLSKLGLDKIRWLLVSGTPVSPETVGFFTALGVDVRPAYSLAEVGGLALASSQDGSGAAVLTPLPGVEVKVESDELLLAGDMVGTIDQPGRPETSRWLHTGDHAEVVEGGIMVMGRAADVITTAAGRRVAPQQLAAGLRASPYVREAVVIPEDGGIVALLEPAFASLGRWAGAQGLRYTTPRSLLSQPEIHDLLRRAVDSAAERMDVRIDEVRVLAKPLSVAAGTLTSTEKVIVPSTREAEVLSDAAADRPTRATRSPSGAPTI